MKKSNPTVGQIIYGLNVRSATINGEQVLTRLIVTKVGRKYFTAQPDGKCYGAREYHLGTWQQKTKFSTEYKLYDDVRELQEDKESSDIAKQIFQQLNNYSKPSQTLDQLRRIAAILNESNQPKQTK